MEPKFRTLKGMHDLLPDFHDYFTFIKKVARHRCRQNGIKRITTPILEKADLFRKTIGENTDVIEKEFYVFKDKNDDMIALRPEGTAGAVRSYIEHALYNEVQPIMFYYIGPMFRRDRPQKGRFRQFNSFGVEIFGKQDPAVDAELIILADTVFTDLGLKKDLKLKINSIGCQKCRKKYIQDLKDFYIGHQRNLCADCQNRLDQNPLRLLDCKEEDCQILAKIAPKMKDNLCEDCDMHYTTVKKYLDELNITYMEEPTLVRGLDYYTKTVFEFYYGKYELALGGGGRYDYLVEMLGGPDTPAVGFGFGIERIVECMKDANIKVATKDFVDVFVVQLGEKAKIEAMKLLFELRNEGIKSRGLFGNDSIKAQLRVADKLQAKYAIVIGEIEVRDNIVMFRDMQNGSQESIKRDELLPKLLKLLNANIDKI